MSNNLRLWTLIQFKPQGRPPAIKLIEIVPTTWVNVDKTTKKCRVLYPPPPYEGVQEMIKNRDDADPDWSSFAAQIKGSDNSYSKGLVKLGQLQRESHAFTLNEGENPKQKEKKNMQEIYRNQLMVDSKNIKSFIKKTEAKRDDKNEEYHDEEVFSDNDLESTDEGKKLQSNKHDGHQYHDEEVFSDNDLESTDEGKKLQSNKHDGHQYHDEEVFSDNDLKSTDEGKKLQSNKHDDTSRLSNDELSEGGEIPSHNNVEKKKLKRKRHEDRPPSSESDDDSDKSKKRKQTKVLKPNTKEKSSSLAILLDDSNSDNGKENLPVKEHLIKKSRNDVKMNKSSVYHASQMPQRPTATKLAVQMDKKISTIMYEIQELKKTLSILVDNSLSESKKNYIATKEQLSEKYQLKFPIDELDTFDKLNELTKANSSFKTDFCEVLKQYVDRNHGISKSCVTILKMILSKKIAEQFVAQREKDGKRTLNTYCFFSCLKEAIVKDRASVGLITTEKEILTKVGEVLSNSKKWADSSENQQSSKSDNQQDRDTSSN